MTVATGVILLARACLVLAVGLDLSLCDDCSQPPATEVRGQLPSSEVSMAAAAQ